MNTRTKGGFRKYDIWLADLSTYDIHDHYVVIVSNYKNNIKSDTVLSCMITSQIRQHPCHVDIKGFGLTKQSQIKCERILELNKSKLLTKIGNINDLFLQICIDRCLEIQLQLDKTFRFNFELDDFTNLLDKGVENMENESKFTAMVNAIRESSKNNLYNETIVSCNDLLELCKDTKIPNKEYYLFFAYYHRGLNYMKLDECDLALEDTKNALCFSGNITTEINDKYAFSMWNLARIYEQMNKMGNAYSIYKKLMKYYKAIGKNHMRLSMLFNMAKINMDICNMNRILIIVSNMPELEFDDIISKHNLSIQMKKELYEIQNQVTN